MPLKAYLSGTPIVASLLDEVGWSSLKGASERLTMPCCGNRAYPRISKLGTRHFVHKTKGACEAKPETLEHIWIKSELVLGCRDAGFEVEPEVSGDGWRADVLATRGAVSMALEIQWSRQTLQETNLRQQRYVRSGIRAAWIFRKPPFGLVLDNNLPVFALQLNDGVAPTIEGMSIRFFACELVSGHFRSCKHVRVETIQSIEIVFAKDMCWKCNRELHVFGHPNGDWHGLKTVHGGYGGQLTDAWSGSIEYHPRILEAIRNYNNTQAGSFLRLGEVKLRHSGTRQRSYLSQGCPYCDAIFGEWFLHSRPDRWVESRVANLTVPMALSNPMHVQKTHWCYSESKAFCESE